MQEYLFAAYDDRNLEAFELISKHFHLKQDVLEDLFMEASEAQYKEVIKCLVANAELAPSCKEISIDYALSNYDEELKELLESNSEMLRDEKKLDFLAKELWWPR